MCSSAALAFALSSLFSKPSTAGPAAFLVSNPCLPAISLGMLLTFFFVAVWHGQRKICVFFFQFSFSRSTLVCCLHFSELGSNRTRRTAQRGKYFGQGSSSGTYVTYLSFVGASICFLKLSRLLTSLGVIHIQIRIWIAPITRLLIILLHVMH